MRFLAALVPLVLVLAPAWAIAGGTARLLVNEVGRHPVSGCHQIELRVVECGSMEGIMLLSRLEALVQFPAFEVQRGDLVIVHVDPTGAACVFGACSNETTGPQQFPAAGCAAHYDAAWDWHTQDAGALPFNHTVLWLLDGTGSIMDAVCLSGNFPPPAGSGTELAAATVADEGQWQRPEGGVPPGGFVGDTYTTYAVKNLASVAGPVSIQRIDNSDDHHMGDWTTENAPHSWAMANAGQASLGSCVTAVGDGAPASNRMRLEARPSVTRGATEFHLAAPLTTAARLVIYDTQGRATRVLWTWAGASSVSWDGRDAAGREASPGLYFARLITPKGVAVARVTRTR
jgi:hypothetical protein